MTIRPIVRYPDPRLALKAQCAFRGIVSTDFTAS
jgi:hypothetical protein